MTALGRQVFRTSHQRAHKPHASIRTQRISTEELTTSTPHDPSHPNQQKWLADRKSLRSRNDERPIDGIIALRNLESFKAGKVLDVEMLVWWFGEVCDTAQCPDVRRRIVRTNLFSISRFRSRIPCRSRIRCFSFKIANANSCAVRST